MQIEVTWVYFFKQSKFLQKYLVKSDWYKIDSRISPLVEVLSKIFADSTWKFSFL